MEWTSTFDYYCSNNNNLHVDLKEKAELKRRKNLSKESESAEGMERTNEIVHMSFCIFGYIKIDVCLPLMLFKSESVIHENVCYVAKLILRLSLICKKFFVCLSSSSSFFVIDIAVVTFWFIFNLWNIKFPAKNFFFFLLWFSFPFDWLWWHTKSSVYL